MDLTRYLDVPDALLQQQFPGVDIAQLKEQIRNMGKSEPTSKPVTQTIKIDPVTGQQEVTIKGSAQDLSAANPFTPTVAAPVIPQAYNQFTAQMESGNRPDIGYHDPSRSTAYGKYGITAPQYQEIQRQNPAFANRPITSLSQQEQDAANMASRDVYARQLVAKGIDPTEENIRMAHLLGAGGTRQYLNTGTFNQAAIDANRGEENLRRMVEQRRAGPVAPQPQARPQTMIAGTPSSDVGLTPTEQAIANQARTPGFNPAEPAPTWMDMTIANQGDPKKLYAMLGDPNLPPEVQDATKQRALSFDQQQQEQMRANQMLQGFAQGDPRATSDVMKAIRQKSESGSYVKAVLYSQLGLSDLARSEQAKLSSGTFSKAILEGKPYMVETKNGAVIRAWDATGAAQGDTVLAQINASSTPQGTQQYQYRGDPAVVTGPDGKQYEVRLRENLMTGVTENVYTHGPFKNRPYTGAEIPTAKKVITQDLLNDVNYFSKLRDQYGTDKYKALAQLKKDRVVSAEEEAQFLQNYGRFLETKPTMVPQQTGQGGVPTVPTTPARPVAPQTQYATATANQPPLAAPVQPVAPGQARPPAPAAPPAAASTSAQVQTQPAATAGYPVRGLNEPENAYKARLDAYLTKAKEVAKAEGKIIDKELQKEYYAKEVFPFVTDLRNLIAAGTGSGAGAAVDATLGFFGVSTPGATAIAATAPLSQKILMQVERFEGPQSDIDVKAYKEAAGKLSDPTVPTAQKQAAFDTIISIMKRNAPDLDWASVEKGGQSDVLKRADEILKKGKQKP